MLRLHPRAARLALAFVALVAPAALAAQGQIIPRRPLPCNPRNDCPVAGALIERVQSEVKAHFGERVIQYEITEAFVNRGSTIGEADYLFPLPKGAAFEDLRLEINGELVSGETLGADEARRIYEEIVRRQRDPALVEWMGYGLLRARIFPIAPGERKTVVVRYHTVAEREGDALRVDYFRGARRGEALPSRDPQADRGRARFSLTLDRAARVGAPYSPTHALDVTDANGRRTVHVRGDARDVTILLPLRRNDEPAVSVLTHREEAGEDGFALVTLSPPARRASGTPRDITFVVDVSGSMRGEKIRQAREAGRQFLASLDPRDRFRIIDFSTDVRSFRDGFVPATPENLRAARRYVDELEADGSTNIAGALRAALSGDDDRIVVPASRSETDEANPRRHARLPLVLFLTDGEPTVGERDPESIAAMAARLRGRARVFTFGLGADLNVALLERLALEGRGTASFVRPSESVERAVSLVASRLTAPAVTDLTVRAEGVRLSRTLPNAATDLFAGQDLVLLTRYAGSGEATLVFSGVTADGPVRWTETVRFPSREVRNPFVARLWATQRVGWLSAERRRNGSSRETDDEIRRLGERYGIPTEFTSYFVREPGMDLANQAAPPPVMSPRRRTATSPAVSGTTLEASGAATSVQSAPVAVAREERFEAAKTAAAQRATSTLADVDASVAGSASGATVRTAAGRTFVLRDGVWVDGRSSEGQRRVMVKPYSEAYFALLARIPALKEPFALGERVLVSGRAVAIELAPAGVERLDEAALARVAAEW